MAFRMYKPLSLIIIVRLSWHKTLLRHRRVFLGFGGFLIAIDKVLVIFGRTISASPCINESQSLPVPQLVHQQQPDGHQGDDDDWECGCTFR